MKTLALLSCVVLTGCATSDTVTQAMLAAHAAAQAQPTITLRCPSGGCEMTYTDPRDRQQFKAPTNGWDAVTSLGQATMGVVQATVVPAALGYVAVRGFERLQGSGAVATTTIGPNSGQNSGNTTPTTTIGANSGANSGNAGRIAGTTMTDTTSTPTVVQQPAPVVVPPPPPVVVTQPAPVIVTQPAPVIVPAAAPAAPPK